MNQDQLFEYLVKPLKDLEAQYTEAFKRMDERFLDLEKKYTALVANEARFDEKLEKLYISPNKLENRISRLEGLAKHIEPLQQSFARLDGDNIDHDNELARVRLNIKGIEDGEKAFKQEYTRTKAIVSELERCSAKLKSDTECAKQAIDDLKVITKDEKSANRLMEQRLLDAINAKTAVASNEAKEAKNSISDFTRRADQFEKAIEKQLGDILEKGAQRQDIKIDANAIEISDLKKKISELIQAVDLMEGRVYRVEKIVETCEKRCDNFGSQIREIKAEIGG